jgi:hypothetical protein
MAAIGVPWESFHPSSPSIPSPSKLIYIFINLSNKTKPLSLRVLFLLSGNNCTQQTPISRSNFTFVANSTMPQVQSLPTVLPESFNASRKILEIRSAYSMTLLLEHAASSNTDPKNRERKLIHARVLGHLLREAPSMQASENVAKQVNSCQNNDQLDALGEMYFLHYICACEPLCPLVVSATLIPRGQSGFKETKAAGLHRPLLITSLVRPKSS